MHNPSACSGHTSAPQHPYYTQHPLSPVDAPQPNIPSSKYSTTCIATRQLTIATNFNSINFGILNLHQHNSNHNRKRTQRRRSSTRPPNSHPSYHKHSKPEHNFYAVEDGVRFRAGPFAAAGAVLGEELVGDYEEGFDALFVTVSSAL
jgi:hypothetical protein